MLFGSMKRGGSKQIKTLIEEFEYPRLGPGMMWEAFQADIERMGGRVELQAPVQRIEHDGSSITVVEYGAAEDRHRVQTDRFVSTMPLRELIHKLSPPPPEAVIAAAARLNYRDFLTVALIIDAPTLFPDNWIYVHDPRVKLGRIQNFKNWSPDMVPDQSKTCLGLEYFCFEGDGLWTMADEDLIRLGTHEIAEIGLLGGGKVVDGTVVRMPKAYPVYDDGFMDALAVVRDYLSQLHEPPGGRPQRHAQVQQPGSLDGDGTARGAEPARRASRRLGRECRRRVPRGVGRRGRLQGPSGARSHATAGASRDRPVCRLTVGAWAT